MSSLAGDDPTASQLMDVRRGGRTRRHLTRQLLAFGRKRFLSPRPVSLNRSSPPWESMFAAGGRRVHRLDRAPPPAWARPWPIPGRSSKC